MNTRLPIYEHKQEIIDAIAASDTLIITAETGSGKSTQVPQYLYEAGYKNITVTQPRRIACISLAERVSKEMNEDIVAYQTAFETSKTENTKILFCTDGLQMARGIAGDSDSVLVIDEAHEWNLNIEGMIAWLKLARTEGLKLKVIIMSATIDTSLAQYLNAKLISIPGRSYPVTHSHDSSFSLVQRIEDAARAGKNVLAFLPGKGEIAETKKLVSNNLQDISAVILSLHGDLMIEEQRRVFKHYNYPKIVISTNVAQTSITIPDIDVVVDSGLERRIEVVDGVESLVMGDISQSDIEQRAGRAGRTRPGEYILCSDIFEEERMQFPTPEIERLDIDRVVLRLAADGLDAEEMEFFHQPDVTQIANAKKMLERIGAVENGQITEKGKQILHIPVSVRFGAMILEAQKYGKETLDDVITMTAIMEVGTLLDFSAKIIDKFGNERKSVYRDYTKKKNSDLLAELEIFRKIEKNEYPDFVGLSEKAFIRIQKYREKMQYLLNNVPEDEHYEEDAIKCVIYGLIDSLMRTDYGDKYVNSDKTLFVLPLSTCITSKPEFLIGIPKQIRGSYETYHVVTMGTAISRDLLFSILPKEELQYKRPAYSMLYNPEKDEIYCLTQTLYRGIVIELKNENFPQTSEEYKNIITSMPWIKQKQEENQVILNKKIYRISEDKPILYLDENELLSSTEKHIFSYKGELVLCKCGIYQSTNLAKLRAKVEPDAARKANIMKAFPTGAKTLSEVYELWKKINDANSRLKQLSLFVLNCGKTAMFANVSDLPFSKIKEKSAKEVRKYLTKTLQQECPIQTLRERDEALAKKFSSFFSRMIREMTFENYKKTIERIHAEYNEAMNTATNNNKGQKPETEE